MDYNNEMAKQFNGLVIHSLLEARHNVYNENEELILHRQNLSLDNATEEELYLIGKFLGVPRPYIVEEGETVECSVDAYRMFIKNVMMCRVTHSILDFKQMIEQFMPDGYFLLEFLDDPKGDIELTVDEQYASYIPLFQQAVDLIFTSLPKIWLTPAWQFIEIVRNHKFYSHIAALIDSDWICYYEDTIGDIVQLQTNSEIFKCATTMYQLRNGDILLGVYDITSEYVGLWKSTDNGATFVHQNTLPSGFGVYDIIESSEGFILVTGKDSNGKTGTVYYSWDNGETYGALTIGSVVDPPTENLRIYGEYEYPFVGISSVGTAYDARNEYIKWFYKDTSYLGDLYNISVMDPLFEDPSIYKHVLAVINREDSNIGFLGRQTNGLYKGEIGSSVYTYEAVGSFEGLYICLVHITSNGMLWVSCTTSGKLYYSSLEDLDNLQFYEKRDGIFYFMLEDNNGTLWAGGEGILCKSNDGGTTFEDVEVPEYSVSNLAFYDMILLENGDAYLYGIVVEGTHAGESFVYKLLFSKNEHKAVIEYPSDKISVADHTVTVTIQ